MDPDYYHACKIESAKTTSSYISNIKVLGGVGILTSVFSFFGSLSIIVFSIAKHISCNEKVKPLFHLACADLLLSLCWISSSWAFFAGLINDSDRPVLPEKAYTCFVWQLLTQIVHMVTFFLTLNYSFSVFYQLSRKVEIVFSYDNSSEQSIVGRHLLMKRLHQVFTIVAWFLPTILLIPVMVKLDSDKVDICKQCVLVIDIPTLKDDPLSDYGYIVWVLSLSIVILGIILLYVFTLKFYWHAIPGFRTNRERQRYRLMKIRISCYIFVFFLCWTPSLIIAALKWYEIKNNKNFDIKEDFNKGFPLYLFQAICAPLQGFLNSLVYGWTRKSFRNSNSNENSEQYQEILSPENTSGGDYVSNYQSINHTPPLGY